ncbi:LysR family transcriptional regulator [Arthrobacter sp. H14]|uniref:LysR family transcriptional regulator n=1 Tax=Arthrobacter sp. H14 TaxID=1312959 RepID=UPI0004B7F398|nr:LysR family transcriptional regulator [Arthrobacter sp. H14]
MFKYTLRQIEFFVAAAETGSVSAAAVRHHVSQAGVSLALAQLEASLGVQLGMRRKSKGFTLTPAGSSFLREARQLLHQAHELQVSGYEAGHELSGRMALGCYSTLSPFILPPLIDAFSKTHPQVELSFVEDSSDALQQEMLTGKLDAVFIHQRHIIPGITAEIIQQRKPYVLLPPAHPLIELEEVPLMALQDMPMVLLDIPSVRENLLPAIRSCGMDPYVKWGSENFETVRALVARGHGYSILMQRPVFDVTYDGLSVAPRAIKDDVGRSDVCLAYPESPGTSRRMRRLIEYCLDLFPLHEREKPPN